MPKSSQPSSYNNYLRTLQAKNRQEIPRSTIWGNANQAATRQAAHQAAVDHQDDAGNATTTVT